jgi:hypothetical protein
MGNDDLGLRQGQPPILGQGASAFLSNTGWITLSTLGDFGRNLDLVQDQTS